MVIATDTSFLFSLYGNDDHTEIAMAWLREHSSPLTLSMLNEFELANALRFSEFKSFLSPGKAEEYWNDYLEDKQQGRVLLERCNLSQVVEKAMQLSRQATLQSGHRSFDILHVAVAVEIQASTFLTFDRNQATLARTLELSVPETFVAE